MMMDAKSSPSGSVRTPAARPSRTERAARRPVAAPGALAVELRAPADLADVIEPWRRLAERAIEPNIFAEPDFVVPGLQHLPEGRPVQLLLVWGGDDLRGVFPVVLPRLPVAPGDVKLWRPPVSSLGVPLIDREGAEAVLEAALDWLAGRGPRFAGFTFPQVPEDGPFAALLRGLAERTRRSVSTFEPHERAVLVAAGRSADDVEGGIRGKTLKELRRQLRRLGEQGEVRIERAREPKAVRDAVEEFLVLEGAGWKGRRGTALVQHPGRASFLRILTRRLAAAKRCRVEVLRVGDQAVAAAIVLTSGRRAWFWKIAYDESFARFSPGVQLTLEITRALLDRTGIELTDSCAVQDHPMIDHLWRDRMQVADFLVAVRPKPSLALAALRLGEAVRRRARAGARDAYQRFARS